MVLFNQNLDIICGPFAIKTFIYVSSFLNWNGKVIDYYDSSNYNSSLIDKYSIDFDNNYQEFVSYVSIIYGSFNNNILLPIDIILAIGLAPGDASVVVITGLLLILLFLLLLVLAFLFLLLCSCCCFSELFNTDDGRLDVPCFCN